MALILIPRVAIMTTMRRTLRIVVIVGLAVALLVATVVFFPALVLRIDLGVARTRMMTPPEYATAVNNVRGSLLQALGGVAVLASAYGAWRQLSHTIQANRDQRHLDRQGQITERFGRSVEHLGSEAGSVRLGGIYGLDRIAAESPDDRDAIANLLAAYIRRESPWPPPTDSAHPADHPIDQVPPLRVRAVDVQAALTVLGRWGPAPGSSAHWPTLDLSDADLRMGNLTNAHLWRVRLTGSNLASANLRNADLRGTDLTGTVLTEVDFDGAVHDETTWWPDDFDPAAELTTAEMQER